jgi:hypothetical protein
MFATRFWRPFRQGLSGAIFVMVLVGCGVSQTYTQSVSAQNANQFRHQHLIGKSFETNVPIAVYDLLPGMANSLELHGVPLGLKIADREKFLRVAYELQPTIIFSAGTVIEMVGEMVSQPGTAMLQPSNYDYFIVHNNPEANDLVLPFSSPLTEAVIMGQFPRAHVINDHPLPFLIAVDAPSQWTCDRYERVEEAVQRWVARYKNSSFELSQRLTSPSCS